MQFLLQCLTAELPPQSSILIAVNLLEFSSLQRHSAAGRKFPNVREIFSERDAWNQRLQFDRKDDTCDRVKRDEFERPWKMRKFKEFRIMKERKEERNMKKKNENEKN